MRRTPVIVGLALLLAVGVACGTGDERPAGAPRADDLDGRTFVTEGLTVSFLDGRLSAQPGCNTVGGPFSIEDGRLVVTDLATTSMACEDPALMDRDTAFAAFVQAGPTITVDGDTLTLAGSATTWVLTDREVAVPDRGVAGLWTLETLVDGDTAASVPVGVDAELIVPPPTATVSTWTVGCGSTAAEVLVDEPARTLAFTGAERGAVEDCRPWATPEEEARVHDAMDAVLTGTVSYEVDADVLTITNGARALQFRAAP